MAQSVVFYLKCGAVLRCGDEPAVFGAGSFSKVCRYCRRCFHRRGSFVDVWFFAARNIGNFRRYGGRCRRADLPAGLYYACITAKLWMLYLLIRALQVVYLIDFKRSLATVAFSLLLLYIAFVLPLRILFELLALKLG